MCVCESVCVVVSKHSLKVLICVWLQECTVDCLWSGLSRAGLMLISLLGKICIFSACVSVCIKTLCVCVCAHCNVIVSCDLRGKRRREQKTMNCACASFCGCSGLLKSSQFSHPALADVQSFNHKRNRQLIQLMTQIEHSSPQTAS